MTHGRVGRADVAFVAAIIAAGLALRLWGITFGLPYVYHPDEGFEIYRALRLGMGGFDLERTGKGGLYFVLFLEYGAYFVLLKVTGALSHVSEFAESFVRNPSPFWLIARVTVAMMGAATIALVAWQARQMQGARAAVLAALFLATSAQHAEDSHFATVDVPMALFTFAALVLIVEDVAGRRRLNPWSFAAIAAFAMLNKVPAALLFVSYFLGAFFRDGWRGPRGVMRMSTLAVPLLTALFFGIANPGIWLEWHGTMQMVGDILGGGGSTAGWRADSGTSHWAFYARQVIASQGLLGVGLALLGVALACKPLSKEMLLHLVFLICYFAMLAVSASPHLYYARYILPLLPGLALLAALGLDRAATRLAGAGARGHLLSAVVALVVVAAPFTNAARFSETLTRQDTRTLTLEWIEANVPAGSPVLLEGSAEELAQLVVPLSPSPKTVSQVIEELSERDTGKAGFWEIKGRTLSEPTYELLTVDHLSEWEPLATHEARGVEWAVIRVDRFNGHVDAKYAPTLLESRHRFYEEMAASPRWFLRASFPTAGELRGYDLEVWGPSGS